MPQPIARSASVSLCREQISCELQGETVILHIGRGRYYSLNASGAAVWSLIQHSCTVQHLVDHLVREYAVEEEVCAHDVQELLHDLLRAQLIEIRE